MPVKSKDHQVLANYLFPRAGGSKGRRVRGLKSQKEKERGEEGEKE